MTKLRGERAMLAGLLRQRGPVQTVRVSSAPSRGSHGNSYPYWGAVRYEIRLSKRGDVINASREAATSDRRSPDLASRDAAELAAAEGRLLCQSIGVLSDAEVVRVLTHLTGGT